MRYRRRSPAGPASGSPDNGALPSAAAIPYVKITASRYAKGMLKEVRTHEPLTLIDKLICGAYIEARSCERFAALAPFLDDDLQKRSASAVRGCALPSASLWRSGWR